MSDEKKYTAREAAIAVLKKAEEVLKKSEIAKAVGDKTPEGLTVLKESKEPKVKAHLVGDAKPAMHPVSQVGSKIPTKPMDKSEPKGEIHPQEHVEGESEKPGERIESQVAPEDNPKEAAEGNNNEWGTQPATYGTLKLAHFLGHVKAKRSQKAKIVAPDAKAVMDPKNK